MRYLGGNRFWFFTKARIRSDVFDAAHSCAAIHLPKDGVSVKIFEGQKLERVESVELASDLTGQKSVKSEVEGSRGSEVEGLER